MYRTSEIQGPSAGGLGADHRVLREPAVRRVSHSLAPHHLKRMNLLRSKVFDSGPRQQGRAAVFLWEDSTTGQVGG